MMEQLSSFIFASDYEFLAEGIKRLHKIVAQQWKKKNLSATLEYRRDSHMWVVTCSPTDKAQVQRKFIGVINKFIAEELGEDGEFEDKIDSEMIARITHDKDGVDISKEGGTVVDCDLEDAKFPVNIDSLPYKAIWVSQTSDMGNFIPATALVTISHLTGATLIENPDHRSIFVGSYSHMLRDRAMHKLNILEKYYRMSHQKVYHIFYTEKIKQFQISIRPLALVRRRLVETTFLDPLRHRNSLAQYNRLNHTYTVRCCPYDGNRNIYCLSEGRKLYAAVQENLKQAEYKVWATHTYPGKGDPAKSPMLHHLLDVDECSDESEIQDYMDKRTEVKKWLTKTVPDTTPSSSSFPIRVPTAIPSNPLVRIATEIVPKALTKRYWQQLGPWESDGWYETGYLKATTPVREVGDVQGVALGTVPLLIDVSPSSPHTILDLSVDMAPGTAPDNTSDMALAAATTDGEQNLLRYLPNKESVFIRSTQSNSKSEPADNIDAFFNHVRKLTLEEPFSCSFYDLALLIGARDASDIENNVAAAVFPTSKCNCLEPFPTGQPSRDACNHAVAVDRSRKGQSIEVEYHNTMNQEGLYKGKGKNAARPRSPPAPAHQDASNRGKGSYAACVPVIPAPVRQDTKIRGRGENSVRLPVPPPPLRQDTNNRGKRENIARRPVPPPPVRLDDPTEGFAKEITANLKSIAASLRKWQGEIFIEAHLGRILLCEIPSNKIADGEKLLSFPAERVSESLCMNPCSINFTNLITNLPADVQWLVDMEEDIGQPMWRPKPNLSVVYEFECFDDDLKVPFIVEIDSETFITKVTSLPMAHGVVYVHCPLRNWDYRVIASGYKDLKKGYEHFAKEIVDHIHLAAGLKTIEMCFELDNSHDIQILSVRVHRKAHYKSLDNKCILNVTEVHDLNINIKRTGGKTIFHIMSSESTVTNGRPSFWYEMGLSSAAAKEAFEENLTLEFGEEAGKWTEDMLEEEGIFSDIFRTANHLIKRLDGFGYWNDNGVRIEAPRAPEPEEVGPGSKATTSGLYW